MSRRKGHVRPKLSLMLGASLAAFAAAGASSRVERKALPDGVSLLEELESPYQSVRAVEDRRWGTTMRLLQEGEPDARAAFASSSPSPTWRTT